MAEIQLIVLFPSDINGESVYHALCDFARYPELSGTVLSVTCGIDEETGRDASTWRVKFREGILEWTEADQFLPERKIIKFELLRGDLEHFAGQWSILEKPGQTRAVLFQAEFDLGIPSLSHILDPLAIESLSGNVRQILDGLFAKLEKRSPAVLTSQDARQMDYQPC